MIRTCEVERTWRIQSLCENLYFQQLIKTSMPPFETLLTERGTIWPLRTRVLGIHGNRLSCPTRAPHRWTTASSPLHSNLLLNPLRIRSAQEGHMNQYTRNENDLSSRLQNHQQIQRPVAPHASIPYDHHWGLVVCDAPVLLWFPNPNKPNAEYWGKVGPLTNQHYGQRLFRSRKSQQESSEYIELIRRNIDPRLINKKTKRSRTNQAIACRILIPEFMHIYKIFDERWFANSTETFIHRSEQSKYSITSSHVAYSFRHASQTRGSALQHPSLSCY